MTSPLRILYLEDDPSDVRLVRDTLRNDGLVVEMTAVDNPADYLAALDADGFDLILSDYSLPGYDGFQALEQCSARYPDLPFVFVSGALGEELAVETLRKGATDYILKDRLSRLGPAVRRALQDVEEHLRRKRAEETLKWSEEALRLANENLEQKIRERTEELARTVGFLQEEARQRQRIQQQLMDANALLTERTAQLRQLARDLTLTEQRERRQLAKVLHDHLQQILVGAKLRVAKLRGRVNGNFQPETVEIEGLLDDAIQASRSLTVELSPPALHEAGLKPGLEWLANAMAEKYGLIVKLTIKDDPHPAEADVKALLFESTRELLFNIVKHAHAQSARLSARLKNGCVQILVSDEGQGFDPALARTSVAGRGRFGLFSIRERLELVGGRMQVDSAPGKGTKIILTVPMAQEAALQTQSEPASGEVDFFRYGLGTAGAGRDKGSDLISEGRRSRVHTVGSDPASND